MTKLEWEQYVSKIAKTIIVPQCDTELSQIDENWKTVSKKNGRDKKVEKIKEPVVELNKAPELRTVTKTYKYKGKTYERIITEVI